uniref:Uncharacterized protein n=1 Tax=Physcomitrium patens TaxID=3218 RepID=A0A2K1IIP5_PHYPA|nr:hypothetical protein PHYPA_027845 [Physcomitrium patens]
MLFRLALRISAGIADLEIVLYGFRIEAATLGQRKGDEASQARRLGSIATRCFVTGTNACHRTPGVESGIKDAAKKYRFDSAFRLFKVFIYPCFSHRLVKWGPLCGSPAMALRYMRSVLLFF